MEMRSIADNLEFSDGIWKSKTSGKIYYPDAGNDDCRDVEESSFWFAHRNSCILELVNRYCRDSYFFDIGGGNGFTVQALERAGIHSVLVEPGSRGVAHAQARGLKSIIASTMEDAGFNKNVMHAVGLFDVIEHIEDDAAFLSGVRDYMAKDGKLLITVPAYNFLWSDADDDAKHFRRYTLGRLESVLTSVGFSTLYSTYIFACLPIPIFFARVLPARLGLVQGDRTEDFKGNHTQSKGLINLALDWEVAAIRKGISIPFGGSCLVVASKIA